MIDTTKKRDTSQCSQPIPYMILKSDQSESNEGLQINTNGDANGLSLSSLSLKCTYVESRPDNMTNQAVDQAFLTQFGTNKPRQ